MKRTIRTEKQELGFAIEINQSLLDSWRASRDEEVNDGLNIKYNKISH